MSEFLQGFLTVFCPIAGIGGYIWAFINSIRIDNLKERVRKLEQEAQTDEH